MDLLRGSGSFTKKQDSYGVLAILKTIRNTASGYFTRLMAASKKTRRSKKEKKLNSPMFCGIEFKSKKVDLLIFIYDQG